MKGLQLVKNDEKNGSVLEQTFFGYPAKRQMRLYASGVLQVQHVAHFTDGLQCLQKQKGTILLYEDKRAVKDHCGNPTEQVTT